MDLGVQSHSWDSSEYEIVFRDISIQPNETGSSEADGSYDPYESRIPNAASLEAIDQARTGEGLISYDSPEEMMADLFGDE